MKKVIIALLVLAPVLTFGFISIKEYKVWDNFASMQVSGSNTVNFIKVNDPDDPSIKCYVAVSMAYTEKAFINAMSCVKVDVVKK